MLQQDQQNNTFRLLDTGNRVVPPINSPVRIIVTVADVLRSWTVPRLGIKTDATPGRLNQVRFSINWPGLLCGQCSEICGANHRFLPTVIKSVSTNQFINWVSKIRESSDDWKQVVRDILANISDDKAPRYYVESKSGGRQCPLNSSLCLRVQKLERKHKISQLAIRKQLTIWRVQKHLSEVYKSHTRALSRELSDLRHGAHLYLTNRVCTNYLQLSSNTNTLNFIWF